MVRVGEELSDEEAETEPPDLQSLVPVAVYSHPFEADIAQSHLQAIGIEAHVFTENIVQMNWLYSNAVGGIRLLVPEEQLLEARKILEEVESQTEDSYKTEEEDYPCPKCGSAHTLYIDLAYKRWTYFLWLTLKIPLMRSRHRMKCNDCGHIWKAKQ